MDQEELIRFLLLPRHPFISSPPLMTYRVNQAKQQGGRDSRLQQIEASPIWLCVEIVQHTTNIQHGGHITYAPPNERHEDVLRLHEVYRQVAEIAPHNC